MQLEGFVEISPCLKSGVYALVAKGKVIYVGKSKSMIARINAHRRKWIDKRKGSKASDFIPIPGLLFDEIHIRPVPLDQLDRVETEMINKYKPRYNVQLKTSDKIFAPIFLTINGFMVAMNAAPPAPKLERRI